MVSETVHIKNVRDDFVAEAVLIFVLLEMMADNQKTIPNHRQLIFVCL